MSVMSGKRKSGRKLKRMERIVRVMMAVLLKPQTKTVTQIRPSTRICRPMQKKAGNMAEVGPGRVTP